MTSSILHRAGKCVISPSTKKSRGTKTRRPSRRCSRHPSIPHRDSSSGSIPRSRDDSLNDERDIIHQRWHILSPPTPIVIALLSIFQRVLCCRDIPVWPEEGRRTPNDDAALINPGDSPPRRDDGGSSRSFSRRWERTSSACRNGVNDRRSRTSCSDSYDHISPMESPKEK